METNNNKNIEQNNETKYSGGWVYLAFLIGIIGIMLAISYLVNWFI